MLAHATEYRQPTARQLAERVSQQAQDTVPGSKAVMNMTSRYLGMIVTPGQHIVKIEVEEFVSQLRSRNRDRGLGEVLTPLVEASDRLENVGAI